MGPSGQVTLISLGIARTSAAASQIMLQLYGVIGTDLSQYCKS